MRGPGGLAPEATLLLLLAGWGPSEEERRDRVLALLREPLAWPDLLRWGRTEGLLPLVHWRLRRLGVPGVPEGVRAELENAARVNALRNTLFVQELRDVLRALAGAGIGAIPLKGVALAERLFGDPALRVCTDIDVLVAPPMVPESLRVLRARGYRTEFAEPFFERLLLRHDIEYELTREAQGFHYVLELQWGLLAGSAFDRRATAALWHAARPRECFGAPAYALTPEWEVLYLVVHAARHRWKGLKWLVDIHELCLAGGFDWDRVRATARQLGWEALLDRTLTRSHALLATPLPPGCPAAPEEPGWVPDAPRAGAVARAIGFIRLLARPSERLRYAARVVLVPTLAERRLIRLPAGLALLYYALRPARLTGRWGWRLLAGAARWSRATTSGLGT